MNSQLLAEFSDTTLQIAQIVPVTEAEGPGRRFAIWFQGCPLRCPGCCNPEFLPFKGGQAWTIGEMIVLVKKSLEESVIEGITLLGGEPFAHARGAWMLAKAIREMDLSVMVFSGFTLEQIRLTPELDSAKLLEFVDILVDGPYERERPDTTRRWVGSTNQKIHFLSKRYHEDESWKKRNTLEIRLNGGEISMNGFPAAHAVGLWKGWKRIRPTLPANSRSEPR